MSKYKLVRSSRRTLGIYILPDASIEVRAPFSSSTADIEAFLTKNGDWIERKQQEVRIQSAQPPKDPRSLWSTLPYRGEEYPVSFTQNDKVTFDMKMFSVPECIFGEGYNSNSRRGILISLYKQITLPLIYLRVDYYSELMNLYPAAVKVSGAVKRWGSCSGKGNLNFSWMLAAAHPSDLDYVVVHELCHLAHHNHSAMFWDMVSSILPDYRERENSLGETDRRMLELIGS